MFNFNAARLPGRVDTDGNLAPFTEQDRSSWDAVRIDRGRRLLDLSAAGDEVTAYHVEAGIACLHASAERVEDIDWDGIVSLYDSLMAIAPSPVVELNRAIAVAQRDGPAHGLDEIGRIGDRDRLASYPFYFAAIGEFELRLGRDSRAREFFDRAVEVARNADEAKFLRERMARIESEAT